MKSRQPASQFVVGKFQRTNVARHFCGAEVEQVNEGIADYLHAADNWTVDFILGRWMGDFADSDSFVHGGLNAREGGFGRLSGTEAEQRAHERERERRARAHVRGILAAAADLVSLPRGFRLYQ